MILLTLQMRKLMVSHCPLAKVQNLQLGLSLPLVWALPTSPDPSFTTFPRPSLCSSYSVFLLVPPIGHILSSRRPCIARAVSSALNTFACPLCLVATPHLSGLSLTPFFIGAFLNIQATLVFLVISSYPTLHFPFQRLITLQITHSLFLVPARL